jgi:hypothetical protein
MSKLGVMVASAVLLAGVAAADEPPRQPPDYEGAFAKSFPLVAGAHAVGDWSLYAALVAGDLVSYASKIDPSVALRFQQNTGKGYQIRQLEEELKRDKQLRAAFEEHRRRISSMILFAQREGVGGYVCRQSLVYMGNEFRLILGETLVGAEPLLSAVVAPGCSEVGETGLQITAGRSSRFKCWTVDRIMTCGWRLPDMPAELKQVIENEYPTSIKVRWRWRGLAGVARVRSELSGYRSSERESIALTLPINLALEFVDGGGQVRWTAPSTGWTEKVPPQGRR